MQQGVIAETASPVIVLRDPVASGPAWVNLRGLTTAGCNLGLATLFFSGVLRGALGHISTTGGLIWLSGAVLMGFFALIRFKPVVELISCSTLAATGGMMLVPLLMRLQPESRGWLSDCGAGVEIAGLIVSQLSRICLGRRFGLLPANRGIMTGGPFHFVRHPIYLGWLVLVIGFTMANPSARNVLLVIVILPFMLKRIEQEEELLMQDDAYRTYAQSVRFRLLPGLI